jgi:hypothetical protein
VAWRIRAELAGRAAHVEMPRSVFTPSVGWPSAIIADEHQAFRIGPPAVASGRRRPVCFAAGRAASRGHGYPGDSGLLQEIPAIDVHGILLGRSGPKVYAPGRTASGEIRSTLHGGRSDVPPLEARVGELHRDAELRADGLDAHDLAHALEVQIGASESPELNSRLKRIEWPATMLSSRTK